MTVSLVQCSAHPALKVFGRCLESLPNLHTLNVLYCNFSKEDIRIEFSKRRYPSIRKVLIPGLACPILHACRKAQTVVVNDGRDCCECMKTIVQACPKVEHIDGISIGDTRTCQGDLFPSYLLAMEYRAVSTLSPLAFSKSLTKLFSLKLIWSPQEHGGLPPSVGGARETHAAHD